MGFAKDSLVKMTALDDVDTVEDKTKEDWLCKHIKLQQ